jgi:hypothetical protein
MAEYGGAGAQSFLCKFFLHKKKCIEVVKTLQTQCRYFYHIHAGKEKIIYKIKMLY